MSDIASDSTATEAQAAADADTQAQEASASAQAATGDPGSLSPEDVRALRKEAANYRTQLRDTQAELKKLQDGELSERQRAERERQSAEARVEQLETKLRDAETRAIAAKVGVKPDLCDTVTALVDWDEVSADDPKAIERAVKELVKERPSLSGKLEGLDGGRRAGGATGETDMNSLIRRAAGRA